ncbi:MAG TPA: YqaA family protein [Acidobacteriota bacterium]|nr:YqaA family protein [Acidobacteriota bacterium]
MRWVRRLYDWVLSFAESPYGTWALFAIAVAESSFFPIPPDVLLIALAVGAPRRALFFALVTTAGSVLGAGIGYWIGYQFFELLGRPIVEFYQMEEQFQSVQQLYRDYDAMAVGIAGFTPIPYKVFTLAAGVFQLNLPIFFLASLISRGLRFFLIGLLILYFGPHIQRFIDRYFNLLAVLFTVLLIGGFLLIKYVIN